MLPEIRKDLFGANENRKFTTWILGSIHLIRLYITSHKRRLSLLHTYNNMDAKTKYITHGVHMHIPNQNYQHNIKQAG